jgi:hypothetical protein
MYASHADGVADRRRDHGTGARRRHRQLAVVDYIRAEFDEIEPAVSSARPDSQRAGAGSKWNKQKPELGSPEFRYHLHAEDGVGSNQAS